MIVVDPSALISILTGEVDAAVYADAIAEADTVLLSAAGMVEAGIVMLRRYGPRGLHKMNALIQESGLMVESVGTHHANLNYGDCFSYALSKSTGAPLLFKGDDFSRTDVEPALP